MTPDPPAAFEELTPEEAAQVDTACDRFERAWKEAKAGGPVPRLASYLGDGHGPAREILFRELIALDRACRERRPPMFHEHSRGVPTLRRKLAHPSPLSS